MTTESVRYSFRLRPGRSAERALFAEWGCSRWVWNQLVETSETRHREDPTTTFGAAAQDKMLTAWRAEHDWLHEKSSVVQQQTVRDFAAARAKALTDRAKRLPMRQRRGLPTWRVKDRDLATLNYTRRGFSLKPDGHDGALALHLAGGIRIPVVWSRELPAEPSSVRVHQDSLGHWYASFVVGIEHEPAEAPTSADPLGIDWGVREIATTTDDALDLPYTGFRKRAQQQLAVEQRKMARRKTPKGQPKTKGYATAKRKVALAHKKVARQRADEAHKWARRCVRAHDRIAIEDFKPRFLAKSTMARKAADGAVATYKSALLWQAHKAGRETALVIPAYTTTDCSSCGARTKRLPLSQRIYTCVVCGVVIGRDKNAAANMVVRAGFNPAGAEGVRPALLLASGQPESGISRL